MGALDGRIAIITGAGRGLGRDHALLFAQEGAKVVVNDLGGDMHGGGADLAPAQQVVDEIEAMGGEAVANLDSAADWDGAQRLIRTAIDTFGDLHVLVNNAGILRDRVIVNMTEEEWDAVIHVHLKGHFCPTRHAAAYWREQSKAGKEVKASIVNTSSTSGLLGNPGQANYGAAKSGIATFSYIASLELGRYGVTANCLAPTAITRLVAPVMGGEENIPEATREALAPRWVAAVATWLASPESRHVTGRVFDVRGDRLAIAEGWHRGTEATNAGTPQGVGEVMDGLLAAARPNGDLDGRDAPDRFTVS